MPIASWDNLFGQLASNLFCRALTTPRIGGHLLGPIVIARWRLSMVGVQDENDIFDFDAHALIERRGQRNAREAEVAVTELEHRAVFYLSVPAIVDCILTL